MPDTNSRNPGRYGLAGFYEQIVPGCDVLPLAEVSGSIEHFPFGGFVQVDEQGALAGEVVDPYGRAVIKGTSNGKAMRFTKQYVDPQPETQGLVFYELTEDWEGGWTGTYQIQGNTAAIGRVSARLCREPWLKQS